MTVDARSTRRALFGAAVALPVMLALPAFAAAAPPDPWDDVIKGFGFLHPDGEATARQIKAAGLQPEHIIAIMMPYPDVFRVVTGNGPKSATYDAHGEWRYEGLH